MTGGVTDTVARTLVRALGRDCAGGATVAKTLLAAFGRALSEEAIAGRGAALGAARRALADFERRGWCTHEAGGWRASATMPEGLGDFLAGAAAMREHGRPEVSAAPVVTLPPAPCLLSGELPATGLSYVRFVGTDAAFADLADAASRTFAVMTPFLNEEGMEWALSLFRRTQAPERTLVVRGRKRVAPYLAARREELTALDVSVHDYLLPGPEGEGYETFHAKVVLADEERAYVGSANLLVYARCSMELGFLVEGPPVRAVASVVAAVRQISPRLRP